MCHVLYGVFSALYMLQYTTTYTVVCACAAVRLLCVPITMDNFLLFVRDFPHLAVWITVHTHCFPSSRSSYRRQERMACIIGCSRHHYYCYYLLLLLYCCTALPVVRRAAVVCCVFVCPCFGRVPIFREDLPRSRRAKERFARTIFYFPKNSKPPKKRRKSRVRDLGSIFYHTTVQQ